MKLVLPTRIARRLERELRRAGTDEIGGVLMGEHVGPDTFRIADLTLDRGGGSFARFVRGVWRHRLGLEAFFRRTGNQFTKFNYLGEWHSHPSFPLDPSGADLSAMRAIVDDPAVGASFAVLMIVRLSDLYKAPHCGGALDAQASLFRPADPNLHPVELATGDLA